MNREKRTHPSITPLEAFISKVENPQDMRRLELPEYSGIQAEMEGRYPKLRLCLVASPSPQDELSEIELKTLIAHPRSSDENPNQHSDLYPTIRDYAAQVLARIPAAYTRDNALFVLTFFPDQDHVNHSVLQRWMKIAGIMPEAE